MFASRHFFVSYFIFVQAVLQEIKAAKLLENTKITGKYLIDGLEALQVCHIN